MRLRAFALGEIDIHTADGRKVHLIHNLLQRLPGLAGRDAADAGQPLRIIAHRFIRNSGGRHQLQRPERGVAPGGDLPVQLLQCQSRSLGITGGLAGNLPERTARFPQIAKVEKREYVKRDIQVDDSNRTANGVPVLQHPQKRPFCGRQRPDGKFPDAEVTQSHNFQQQPRLGVFVVLQALQTLQFRVVGQKAVKFCTGEQLKFSRSISTHDPEPPPESSAASIGADPLMLALL